MEPVPPISREDAALRRLERVPRVVLLDPSEREEARRRREKARKAREAAAKRPVTDIQDPPGRTDYLA